MNKISQEGGQDIVDGKLGSNSSWHSPYNPFEKAAGGRTPKRGCGLQANPIHRRLDSKKTLLTINDPWMTWFGCEAWSWNHGGFGEQADELM
jgi:hypothetical protein